MQANHIPDISEENNIIIEFMESQSGKNSIEEICHHTFKLVSELIENKVVNKDLAWLNKNDYLQGYHAWDKRINGLKPTAAKYWLLFLVLAALLAKELIQNDRPNYISVLMLDLLFGIFLKTHQRYFGTIPFQSVGTMLFLNKADERLCENDRQYEITHLQVKNASLLSPLRLFSSNFLDKAFESGKLDFYEHDAILRCFFGLKNKSFDCVNISVLLFLSLIEIELPTSILRIKPATPNIYGHHYVLTNFSDKSNLRDIATWNDDALIVDPWYEVCVTAREINNDKDFFIRYPLLNPHDKIIAARVWGNKPSQVYKDAVVKMKQLRDQFEKESNPAPSYSGIVFPRF